MTANTDPVQLRPGSEQVNKEPEALELLGVLPSLTV